MTMPQWFANPSLVMTWLNKTKQDKRILCESQPSQGQFQVLNRQTVSLLSAFKALISLLLWHHVEQHRGAQGWSTMENPWLPWFIRVMTHAVSVAVSHD